MIVVLKKTVAILYLCLFCMPLLSQQQKEIRQFINVFNAGNYSERIHMFDTLPKEKNSLYYPYVKDSMEAIRKKAYADNRVDMLNKLDMIDGMRYFYEHNYSASIPLLIKVISVDHTLTDTDSLSIYSSLKNSYFRIRAISKALEMDKIIRTFSKRPKVYSKWYYTPTLSNIYYELGIYNEAIRQHRLEFAESPEKNDNAILSYHNNQGVFWNRLKEPDSALLHFELAKKLADKRYHNSTKPDEAFVVGLIDGNIGQVYKEKKKYREAVPLLRKDIYWSLASNNKDNAIISYNELAECYIYMANYGLAQKYLDSARIILAGFQDVAPRQNNIRLYGLLYEKSGNYTESIRYYKRYIQTNDSLSQAEKQMELISQQVALQLDEKENIIRKKQQIIDRELENGRHQTMVRRTLLAGLLFLLFTLVVLFIMYRRSNRQKQLLEIRNEEIRQQHARIEKSLQEKDFLVREVHHRVKNNLQIISSLLNLQMSKTANEEIRIALSEARQRIMSIAFVHSLLYRNKELAIIPVKEYFESLLRQLEGTFSDKNSQILLNKQIADIYMDLDRSIPLGLIINEVISNAYKHAFPGKKGTIDIVFSRMDNMFELKISDNGVGFDRAAFDDEQSASFGIEVIKILSEQINGRLVFDGSRGVSYTITFS